MSQVNRFWADELPFNMTDSDFEWAWKMRLQEECVATKNALYERTGECK